MILGQPIFISSSRLTISSIKLVMNTLRIHEQLTKIYLIISNMKVVIYDRIFIHMIVSLSLQEHQNLSIMRLQVSKSCVNLLSLMPIPTNSPRRVEKYSYHRELHLHSPTDESLQKVIGGTHPAFCRFRFW